MNQSLVHVYTEAGVVTLMNPSRQLLQDWATVVGMSDDELRTFVIMDWVK